MFYRTLLLGMIKKTRKFKKSRKSKKNKRHSRKSKKFFGGAQDSWRLPPHAVVIWRNLQEDEDAAPVVTSYEQTREDLDLPPLEDNQKIENEPSEYSSTIENAKSSGRKEVQV